MEPAGNYQCFSSSVPVAYQAKTRRVSREKPSAGVRSLHPADSHPAHDGSAEGLQGSHPAII